MSRTSALLSGRAARLVSHHAVTQDKADHVAGGQAPGEGAPQRDPGGTDRYLSAGGQRLSNIVSRATAVPAVVSLVVVAIFFQSQSHYFLSAGNLSNLAVQVTIIGTLALAEVIILLLAEIDLSVGSVSGASAAILGVLLTTDNLPWWAAIIVMLICGAAIGAFQGMWVAWLGIPSFVVTLAGLLTFLGLQWQILGANGTISLFDSHINALTGTTLPKNIGWILVAAIIVAAAVSSGLRLRRHRASGRPGSSLLRSLGWLMVVAVVAVAAVGTLNRARGVPTAFLVFVSLVFVAWWVTEHTRPGRHLFAVGGNAEAARRAGIPVKRIRFAAFAIAGTLAAVSGLLSASFNSSAGTLTGGGTLLLTAIGAAVIGGTSLFGGEGTVWAALFGALILAGVDNGLDLTNHTEPVKYMVEGSIVLLAVTVDTLLRRRGRKGRQLGGIEIGRASEA